MNPSARIAACLFVSALLSQPAISADFQNMPVSTSSATSIGFLPDGSGIYIGDPDGNVRLWDLSTGEVKVRVKALSTKERGTVATNIVRVSADGKHALTAYGSGEIRYVSLSTGKEIWQAKFLSDQLLVLAISPDGKLGLASDISRRLVLFATSDGGIVWDFKHSGLIVDAAFSASGDLIFEAETGRFRAETLEGYLAPFDFDVPGSGSAFFDDIDVAKNGVVAAADNGEVHLYDGKSGKRLKVVKIKGKWSGSIVAISDDGRQFLTELENGQAGLFDTKSGKQMGAVGAAGEHVDLEALAFSPDGRRFVIADDDGRISLWRTKGLNKIATARLWSDGYAVFLPNGAFMAEPGKMGGILALNHYDLLEAKPDLVKAAFAK
ncbi:MAG: PQQ-binding-like beta-propeller repeat protein [Mesorhizobium sp.]